MQQIPQRVCSEQQLISGLASFKEPKLHSACGTASSQPQGNNCWDFALKVTTRARLGRGAQPHGERAVHYVLCNQQQPCPTAPWDNAWVSLVIFHKLLI